jgi:antitoxin ParD1/3/4
MSGTQKTLTVDLGPLYGSVEERVSSGRYSSSDEVICAALHALEREEEGVNEWFTRMAEESLADPRPSVPLDEVFDHLWAKYKLPQK